MSARLIVFAREPVLGQVKQRLAADVGHSMALLIYRRLLSRTLRLAHQYASESGAAVDLRVYGADLDTNGYLAEFCGPRGIALRAQSTGDLGARMRQAMQAERDHNDPRTVLIGCDCPAMMLEDLRMAFAALQQYDAVMSPTFDGGYCLIGTRANDESLFADMPWGEANIAALSRERLKGVRLHELRAQPDIDYWQDWLAWRQLRADHGLSEASVPEN